MILRYCPQGDGGSGDRLRRFWVRVNSGGAAVGNRASSIRAADLLIVVPQPGHSASSIVCTPYGENKTIEFFLNLRVTGCDDTLANSLLSVELAVLGL